MISICFVNDLCHSPKKITFDNVNSNAESNLLISLINWDERLSGIFGAYNTKFENNCVVLFVQ